MAHFRLLSDVNFLPYGRSYLEPGRKIFKQYVLMEDAMLIHRIVRAPEKRIFYVNVGSIPPNEVENYMQKMINKMKKVPYIDPQTGQYNLKYNMQNTLEDFYIPVRGNDSTTRIDTTKGLEYNGIDDVNYLKDKSCPSCSTTFKYIATTLKNPADISKLLNRMKTSNINLILIERDDYKKAQAKDALKDLFKS
jgi:hypothetical protein